MLQMNQVTYDRTAEDLGNIVELGHVNVNVADQGLATTFYVTALGLTRDPFLMTATNNMWVNVGRSQFHLPTREAGQVLQGVTGLVVPDLDVLRKRLEDVRPLLAGTQFAVRDIGAAVETTSPWGNRIRLHAPDPERFGPIILGMAYIEFDAKPGTAPGIARFYREMIDAPATVVEEHDGRAARVPVGPRQWFAFREASESVPYDGNHVQVYLANFSGPYKRLLERGLISQESNRHQYRFVDIVDLDSGAVLHQIDHEVRSMSHPMFARPLVNRDPAMNNNTFHPGQESLAWAMST
jgi:catechol 2,3-dioxygenase-like lactoylglutathione lyase family enzyme